MSYKYSKGAQVIGDLKAADDAERNTQIDFGEDQIDLQTGGNVRFKISGSNGEITFNQAYTFPYSDGSANQILKTNGSGQLSWVNESGGGGGSTNAAGNDGQIQYNNGGTNFGGASQLYYDDSNNRLGIGISAPDQLLHVQDGNILLQHNANNQFSTELQFTKSGHGTDGSQTVVQTGDILGEIVFKGSDGDEFVTAAAITGKVGYTTPGNNDMPGNIIFSTTQDGSVSLTEALRIDQSQGVVVKNGSLTVMGFSSGVEISGLDSGANSYNGMSFSYGAFAPGRAGIVIRGQNSNTVGTLQVRIEQDDTGSPNDVLIIGISGNATFSGTVTENSDARIKTNIRDLPNNTLSKVLQLRPVQFNRINQPNDNEDTSKEYMGFIAQEVETIFPDAVHTRTNDPDNVFGDIQDLKSIANKELIAVLTKAIQEQQEQIEELKTQVAALQN